MKKTIIGLLLSLFAITTNAQWTETGDNTTTGNLGIGTTTPVVDLQIESEIVPVDSYPPSDFKDYFKNKDYDLFYLNRDANSDIGPSIFFKGTNNATSFSARIALLGKGGANGDLAFLTSATDGYNQREVMRVTHNGNVGIGTYNPEAKLNIISSKTIAGNDLANSSILVGTTSAGIGIDSNEILSKGYDLFLGSLDKDVYFKAGGSTRMFVEGVNGNVGIGTNTPDYKLDVVGTIKGSSFFTNGTYYGTEGVRSTINPIEITSVDEVILGSPEKIELDAPNISLSNFVDINNEFVHIKNNVGIGTIDTKGFNLAVVGDTGIIAEKVTVKLATQWPDYVFTKDYELPSLKEVEQQIKEKGHLANIPSAIEVKENGIELGDMNKKLLEKIEELTLYTIQQEKKLELQNTENKELKNRLTKIEELLEKLSK